MFILLVLAAAILVGLARGGKLTRFADLRIRWRIVILFGFLVQVMIFSDFWQINPDLRQLTPLAYLASLVLLLIAVTANRRIPGMTLITFGFLCNFVAIALNGGFMPASPTALEIAGMPPLAPHQTSHNSIGMGPDTRLWFLADIFVIRFLADIFAIPKGFPLRTVFSIGDVLIAIGAVYLIQKVMVRPSVEPVAR